MPADNKKLELRSQLAGKSTRELEELLALDFAQDKNEVDADYISTILEVIAEREEEKDTIEQETQTAWNEFREFYPLSKENELLEAGTNEKPNLDHQSKTEHCHSPRKYSRIIRNFAVAAVLVVLLCGTALGWNIFKIIAEWTEETFQFLSGQADQQLPEPEVLDELRAAVAEYTDAPMVPNLAPAGTTEYGNMKLTERNNRIFIGMGYMAGDRTFGIQIIVYDSEPQNQFNIYQKDITIEEEYQADGITHYIMGNNKSLSAMWTNGCVEGYIQGELTLEEIRQMIDSIYSEE